MNRNRIVNFVIFSLIAVCPGANHAEEVPADVRKMAGPNQPVKSTSITSQQTGRQNSGPASKPAMTTDERLESAAQRYQHLSNGNEQNSLKLRQDIEDLRKQIEDRSGTQSADNSSQRAPSVQLPLSEQPQNTSTQKLLIRESNGLPELAERLKSLASKVDGLAKKNADKAYSEGELAWAMRDLSNSMTQMEAAVLAEEKKKR